MKNKIKKNQKRKKFFTIQKIFPWEIQFVQKRIPQIINNNNMMKVKAEEY